MDCNSLSVALLVGLLAAVASTVDPTPEIVYQWNIVEYEWPNGTMKQNEIDNGNYVPENSAVNGIKLYKDKVYVTVPRLKPNVPSTLNVVVKSPTSSANVTSEDYILRPFPNWAMQEVGNCEMFQGIQSMEIDPHTGYMWIVDTGTTCAFYLLLLLLLFIIYTISTYQLKSCVIRMHYMSVLNIHV